MPSNPPLRAHLLLVAGTMLPVIVLAAAAVPGSVAVLSWRELAIAVAIGAALLAIGLAFAVWMALRFARAAARRELLISELNHGVRNTLAAVQSVAAQTFRHAPDPAEAAAKFEARLAALSRTHDVLSRDKGEGADVREIVGDALGPFAARHGNRIALSGCDLRLASRCALVVSMALHELAANAASYGALSNDAGTVRVRWTRIDCNVPKLWLEWSEAGGPAVLPADREGYGSRLIQHSFTLQLGGTSTLELDPGGVICILECPLQG